MGGSIRAGRFPRVTARTFERAEAVRPPDNDDAILRWNACARVLMRHPHLKARDVERDMPLALE